MMWEEQQQQTTTVDAAEAAVVAVSASTEIVHRDQMIRSHDINSTTITSTVHIRVTPRDDFIVSWSILWGAFFVASILLAWQVFREHRILKAREASDVEHAADAVSTADRTRCTVRTAEE